MAPREAGREGSDVAPGGQSSCPSRASTIFVALAARTSTRRHGSTGGSPHRLRSLSTGFGRGWVFPAPRGDRGWIRITTGVGTMTSDTGRSGIPDWLPAYSEAWNSHDPAKVLAFLTEDVVFDDKGL